MERNTSNVTVDNANPFTVKSEKKIKIKKNEGSTRTNHEKRTKRVL